MNRTQPIDYKSVLSLFLPAGLLDYFDITEASNMGDYFMLVLVEKDIVPENLQDLPLISNGFHKPITVTDFPVRDHTMYFRIKRRRWLDKSTGKSYSRDWNLVASGTRITAEFGAFLKELPWYPCSEHQERCRVYAFEGKCPKWLLQEPSERISLMESEKHSDEFTLSWLRHSKNMHFITCW